MQIRQSKGGKTIQVSRSVYVPEKKRSTQLLVITFPSYPDKLPDNASEKLEPEEMDEVQAWLDKRKADREESGLKYIVADLPKSINLAAEGLTKYGITSEQAQAIYSSIDKITKVIHKAGFTRPKSEPVKPPEPTQKKKRVSGKSAKKAGKKKPTQKKTVKKAGEKKTAKKAGGNIAKKVAKKKVTKTTRKKADRKNAYKNK